MGGETLGVGSGCQSTSELAGYQSYLEIRNTERSGAAAANLSIFALIVLKRKEMLSNCAQFFTFVSLLFIIIFSFSVIYVFFVSGKSTSAWTGGDK